MAQPKEHATLWQHVYGHKSPLAKRWLIWATAVQVVLLLSGALLTVGRAYGSWTNRDVAAALSLILLLIAAWRMRVGTPAYQGRNRLGVRYVYGKSGRETSFG